MIPSSYILGAGFTGIGAGLGSGWPILEAASTPGGICMSYYMDRNGQIKDDSISDTGDYYRFEKGGGHWIFGASPLIQDLFNALSPVEETTRKSGVWLQGKLIPFPLQENLRFLEPEMTQKVLQEMLSADKNAKPVTLKDWLSVHFGNTLCQAFFHPFHALYTAGLYEKIQYSDTYKSPVDVAKVIRGAFDAPHLSGYNTRFCYPALGLDHLVRSLSQPLSIEYNKKITGIDTHKKILTFQDGTERPYKRLISTIPLNKMLELIAPKASFEHSPSFVSTVVLNIAGEKGAKCPGEHWIYFPTSNSGFHRVGFYSNVSNTFLPNSLRQDGTHVSMYVERSVAGGQSASEDWDAYASKVKQELLELGYLKTVEACDISFVEIGYTFQEVQSDWHKQALEYLHRQGIVQCGRFGRWKFQGIAESLEEGMLTGLMLEKTRRRE